MPNNQFYRKLWQIAFGNYGYPSIPVDKQMDWYCQKVPDMKHKSDLWWKKEIKIGSNIFQDSQQIYLSKKIRKASKGKVSFVSKNFFADLFFARLFRQLAF
ncbi:MAG: hypothetical protein QME61_04205 [Patescibacteria group bacterium]|nr:hypothetical protein [Patescibacteria group bacterium]